MSFHKIISHFISFLVIYLDSLFFFYWVVGPFFFSQRENRSSSLGINLCFTKNIAMFIHLSLEFSWLYFILPHRTSSFWIIYNMISFLFVFFLTLLHISLIVSLYLPSPRSYLPFPLALTTLLSVSVGYAYMFLG